MSDRLPGTGKLRVGETGIRPPVNAVLADVDAVLRREGEALTTGAAGDHVTPLISALDELRRNSDRLPDAEVERRLGVCHVLIAAAYARRNELPLAQESRDHARRLLARTGLEDLPADVLAFYAEALLQSGDTARAAAAVRQAGRRGYGQHTVQVAAAVADRLAEQGDTTTARDLLADFADTAPRPPVEDDWQLADTLARHGLTDLAVRRYLALGARLEPGTAAHREAFLRAVSVSDGDPEIAVQCATALAPVDVEAALGILDQAAAASDDPAVSVVRAEILALSGHLHEAEKVVAGLSDTFERPPRLDAVLGLLAYLRDDYQDAVTHLRIAAAAGDDLRTLLLLGDAAQGVPDPDPDVLAEAAQHLRRWLAQRGADGQVLSVLALVERASGDESASETLFTAAERDDALPWVYRSVAEMHRLAGEYEQALRLFDKAIAGSPNDAWAIGSRGQTKGALRDVAGAVDDLAAALSLDPTLLWAFDAALAVAEPASPVLDPVLQVLTATAADVGLDSTARAWAARSAAYLLAARGDRLDALALLEQVGQYAPPSAAVAVRRAALRWELGDLEGARGDLARAAQLDTSLDWALDGSLDFTAVVVLADADLRTQIVDRLDAAGGDATLTPEERLSALLYAAGDLARAGEPDLADRLLDTALRVPGGDAQVLVRLGDTLMLQGRHADALHVYEGAVDASDRDQVRADALASRGLAKQALGDVRGAEEDLRSGSELDPHLSWALSALASVIAEEKPAEARKIYRRQLRSEPGDVAAARGLSAMYVDEGRLADAVTVLERCERHASGDDLPIVRSIVVSLALQMEDDARADEVATRLVQDWPDSAVAWLAVANVHNHFGEWAPALAAFDAASQRDATSSDALGRAWALEYDGRLDEAATELENALQRDSDPYLRRQHALVRWELGAPDGQQLLEQALAGSADRRSAVTLAHEGFCLAAIGRNDEASRKLVEALDIDPTALSTQLDLALVLLVGGRSETGIGEYRRALSRVTDRSPRRQVGLLRVALADLRQMQARFPTVQGYDRCEEMIVAALQPAEARAAGAADAVNPPSPATGTKSAPTTSEPVT